MSAEQIWTGLTTPDTMVPPATMRACALGDSDQVSMADKSVPIHGREDALLRICAINNINLCDGRSTMRYGVGGDN